MGIEELHAVTDRTRYARVVGGETRARILERRAAFIAAALSACAADGCSKPRADIVADDAAAKPPPPAPSPSPALSATAAEEEDAGTHPRVCLSIRRPPRHDAGPGPCLKVAPEGF
jgi:hypothetical protein